MQAGGSFAFNKRRDAIDHSQEGWVDGLAQYDPQRELTPGGVGQTLPPTQGESMMSQRSIAAAAAVAISTASSAMAAPKPLSDVTLVTSQRSLSSVAPGQPFSHFVRCPTGKKVLGGGYSVDTPQSGFLVTVNGPSTNRETWALTLRNVSSAPISVVATVAATCSSD